MKKTYFNILAAIGLSISSFSVLAANEHYAVYIDAGSSGSRLYIYQYDTSSSAMPIVTLLKDGVTSVQPGLSSFANHPEEAGKSLKPILDSARDYLQNTIKTDIKNVPVNVLGTAGMRLVPDQAPAIYASVTKYLSNYSFASGDVETIPGKMEGLYGWLDVNYLSNNFQNHQNTVGSIDMGGASTQIAYEIHKNKKIAVDDLTTVAINNQIYTVFSKSFLGLGQDQARATMINDPTASACYPSGFVFNPPKPDAGNFNFATCGKIFEDIIQKQAVLEQIPPVKDMPFIAYSGIYYTYNFFKVDQTPDQTIVINAMNTLCNEPWDQIQKEHPGDKYASGYCANGVYQNELLYQTYGIKGYRLTVENQITQGKDSNDIDWTLGAMLYQLVR